MNAPEGRPNIAIVHDKFTVYAGAEKCVEQMHQLWPEAPIFTSVCDLASVGPVLAGADIRPSPMLRRWYRGGDSYAHLLPLLPLAMARHDLRDFDIVVTSHHAFANRIRPRPGARVVAYTYTPARWIWDPTMRAHEVGGRLGRAGLRAFAARQRGPDRRAAQRADRVVAISNAVAERIDRWWDREATVIAPPVDVEHYRPGPTGLRDDFYLLAGRLVPYKRPDVAVAAARRAGVRLVVAGEGRARAACESLAGPGTEFVGRVDDETLRDLYRRCRALVFPGVEDFGIVPVEAQACGAPVIAVDAGGARDTVIDGITGIRYTANDDPVASLAAVLAAFDADSYDPGAIRANAERFEPGRFRSQLAAAVDAGPEPEPGAP